MRGDDIMKIGEGKQNSKAHISIPEFARADLTYEECYRVVFTLIKHEVFHLKNIHTSESIDELKAYPLQIASRILKSASTLHAIIEQNKDYVVANAIVRTLADTMASLYLIYQEDGEAMVLRHYLYVLDGINNRLKYLPENMFYDNSISKDEFDVLMQQVVDSKTHYTEARQHCQAKIRELSLYAGKAAVIEKLMEKCNWKYKTLGSSNIQKNKYTWNEMYDLLHLKCDSGFFSFFGEFVHGLSTSNIAFEPDVVDFEPVYGAAIVLLGRLYEFINNYYADDMNIVQAKAITGLADVRMPQKYVDYLLNELSNLKEKGRC